MTTTYESTQTSTDAELGKGEAVCEAVPAYKQTNNEVRRPEPGKRYTYADYLTWNDGKRYELIEGIAYELDDYREIIDGVIYALAAPTWAHQRISGEIYRQLSNFLIGKPCKAVTAPYDIYLDEGGASEPLVQPDIVVICDHTKRTKEGYRGAPDFIIEILSPSTAQKDKLIKLRLYEKHGVREYWIVEPDTRLVTVYTLGDDGRYKFDVYDNASKIPVSVLPGCTIDLTEVFAE